MWRLGKVRNNIDSYFGQNFNNWRDSSVLTCVTEKGEESRRKNCAGAYEKMSEHRPDQVEGHRIDLEVNNALLVLQKAGVIDGSTHTGMNLCRRRKQVLRTYQENVYEIIKMSLILNALSVATNSDDDLHGICRFLSQLRASVNMVGSPTMTEETGMDKDFAEEGASELYNSAGRVTLEQVDEDEWDVANMHVAQVLAWHTGQLVELWNNVNANSGQNEIIDDGESVADGIEKLKETIKEKLTSIGVVNLLTQGTRWKVVEVMEDALRRSLRITEEDTRERAGTSSNDEHPDVGQGSSIDSHVRLQIARGRAMGSKMEMIRAEMASFTYTSDSVRALKALSSKISQRVEQVSEQVESQSRLLSQYQNLDKAQFAAIASQYSQLKTRLDQSLWNLRELGHGLN